MDPLSIEASDDVVSKIFPDVRTGSDILYLTYKMVQSPCVSSSEAIKEEVKRFLFELSRSV